MVFTYNNMSISRNYSKYLKVTVEVTFNYFTLDQTPCATQWKKYGGLCLKPHVIPTL